MPFVLYFTLLCTGICRSAAWVCFAWTLPARKVGFNTEERSRLTINTIFCCSCPAVFLFLGVNTAVCNMRVVLKRIKFLVLVQTLLLATVHLEEEIEEMKCNLTKGPDS